MAGRQRGTWADDEDIAQWMAQRNASAGRLRLDIDAAGRERWAAATRAGEDLAAPTSADVTALGLTASATGAPANAPSTPSNISDVPSPKGVDMGKIVEWEGGNRLDTYGVGPKLARDASGNKIIGPDGLPVVADWHPSSGITTGQGVDLGQRSVPELRQWGLNEAEINVVKPFMDHKLRGRAAAEYPHANLDATLVDKLNRGAKKQIIGAIEKDYNEAAAKGAANWDYGYTSFDQLPAPAATVVGSMAYNMGVSGLKSSPLWNHIPVQNWSALAAELRAFKGKNQDRRHEEGKYLQAWIDSTIKR